MSEAVIAADAGTVNKLVEDALGNGIDAKEVLDNGLIPGMDVVGQRMKTGEMFIPEVLRSAKVMQAAMDLLRPHMSEKDSMGLGTFVIGTVEGDLHDIGKNLVSMMLQGAGFTVVDLGTSVKPQDFVDAVKKHKAAVVGMSALLTTTVLNQEAVIQALEEAGLRDRVKVIVGGVPTSPEWAQEIGADAYAENAVEAVQVLDSFNNVTYADGQAAALYKKSVPKVNASRGPGLWQSYDIHVERAKLENGKAITPATITVFHNNVLVQDKVEFRNNAQAGTLRLQDHKNPVRYRNIWFKPAKP